MLRYENNSIASIKKRKRRRSYLLIFDAMLNKRLLNNNVDAYI